MKIFKFIYNEKTKRFEPVELGWIDLLNPLSPSMDLWQLGKYLIDRLNLPGKLSKNDAENIREILKEGRNQKVDEMEIEMSREAATGFNFNDIKGVDITFGNKGKTKYVMRVKYKYDD